MTKNKSLLTVTDLLGELAQRGIRLSAQGNQLQLRAPKGALTPDLREQLAVQKGEILRLLHARADLERLSVLPQIVPDTRARHEPFPLTDIQQAYWIGRSSAFEMGNISIQIYLEIESPALDLERFTRAWRRVVERHDMLRAVILADGRQQILAEVPDYEPVVRDLSQCSPEEREAKLEEVRESLLHRTPPGDDWPSFEIHASHLDGGATRLHFCMDMLHVDGGSLRLLFADLVSFYQNPDVELPPFELSYRDYVLAEIALQESELYQKSFAYWRERVKDLPAAPQLPLERNPGELDRPRFAHHQFSLDAETWSEVKTRISQRGLTPAAVLLTAYAEVLGLWSKSPDLTINVTLFNRLPLHPQIDQILGDFTSMVLLGVAHAPDDSFEARVRSVQERLWSDLEHRQVSGVKVLRELARVQSSAQGALMPVVFTSFLNLDSEGSSSPSALLDELGEGVFTASQTPQVWIDHQVLEDNGELVLSWDGVEELFPAGLLEELFHAYRRLVGRLVDDRGWDRPPRGLLPESQLEHRAAVLERAREPDTIPEHTLFDLFTQSVDRRGEHPAVIAPEITLSYDELQQRAHRLGRWLRERFAAHGLDPADESLVAVVMPKGWHQVVAALGTHASGAAYLPIDPELPAERFRYLLDHGRVHIALTHSSLADLDWPEHVERLELDRETETAELDDSPLPALEVELPNRRLAYVIYTSGSTGLPKGVMIEHRSAVNRFLDINRRYGIGPEDRVLGVTALHHDLSVYDVFGILAAGGTLVLPEAAQRQEPSHWAELMRRHRVTRWNSVPAFLQMLVTHLESLPPEERDERLPRDLRWVILAGDWIPVDLPDRLRRLLGEPEMGELEIIASGGPTETTIWDIHYRVGEVDPAWSSIPYGQPLANTRYYVLNSSLEPCPDWVPGELYIAGDGLARGYWDDEERTAASFLTFRRPAGAKEHPGLPRDGERLYKSGDLGRLRADGNIEFLGRADFQVKIRGHRIELGEVESTLLQHPAVDQAVVTVLGERHGNQRLVAYHVPPAAAGGAAEATDLRAFLEAKVPSYMVPTAYVALDALPLTANGKIDRRALPDPEEEGASGGAAFTPPRNPLEEEIAGIWRRLLDLETLGVFDNLLDLGGNSLVAIQIAGQLRESLDVEIPLGQLLANPTVAGLAELVTHFQESGDSAAAALPMLTPAPEKRHEPFALNEIQQAYWVGRLEVFELGNVAAHYYLEIDGGADVDLDAFSQGWQRVVARHDMLRAVIHSDGRQQILEDVPPYRVELEDFRDLPPEEAEASREALRQRMSHQVRPTDRWPLFEFRASQVDDTATRFHFSLDLLIVDAWSAQILFDDLRRYLQHPDEELPPLEVTFRDYLEAERELQDSELVARSRSYWKERIPELPAGPQLPLATDPSNLGTPRFQRRSLILEKARWDRLQERARELGLTSSGVLMAAFGEVLGTWSRSRQLALNVTTFRRLPLHRQIDNVVGDFTSLTLLAIDNRAAQSFATRAQRLQERLWQDLEHRFVNGVEVLRDLASFQGRAPGALMPVVFTSLLARYEGQTNEASPDAAPAAGDGAAEADDWNRDLGYAISQTPQVWLDHQAVEQGGNLQLNWDSVVGLFPEGLLDAMFDAYRRLLLGLAESETTWHRVPCRLLPPEQEMLFAETNATEQALRDPDAPAATLHGLFLERVDEHRDDPAVITGSHTLTYGQLESHSRDLAAWLVDAGARPDHLVAVVMDKGWTQAAATLGILRAGAAYLPIDPEWPAARRDYLLDNGRVEVVLTQSHLELEWPESVRCLTLDEARPEDLGLPATPVDIALPTVGERDLAYVIFTSGSTGEPKGVAIEHHSAANTVLDIDHRFRVGPDDRVFALSALNFDLSVYDLFGTLAAGAALVLPESAARRDPSRWAELLAEHRVSVWNSVPALLQLLLEHADDLAATPGSEPAIPESLRLAMLSGDWLPVDIADRLRSHRPGAEVVSLGGATEAAIWSIAFPIGDRDPEWASIPYGKPLANQQLHVLDENLEPCPVWVPGELYIGGVGLARGYWRDPVKTAQRFPVLPGGERGYRTGDLGRRLPDGNIEFLGREDFQIKIQGYRIELGEIESALREHPAVANVLVEVTGEARDEKRRLVAYHTPSEAGEPAAPEELRALAEERLPSYMVPAAFVPLATFPLTANGKIDRKALPAPDSLELAAEEQVAPRTRLESDLAELWKELLEVDSLGIHDELFDLGGNSLVAIRMLSRLRQAFQVEISLRELFEHSTIATLAAQIAQLKADSTGGGLAESDEEKLVVTPAPEARFEPFLLNQVQQAYLLGRMDNLELGNVAAHSYLEVEITTREPERIERAWRRLIERHDMLRCIFPTDGSQQVLETVPDLEIPILDLTTMPSQEGREALARLRQRLSHQVLPTDRWPLFELYISRHGEDRYRIHISFDLLISDAWSSEILLREFGLFAENPDLELPPLELTFRDYLLAEEQMTETMAYRRSKERWTRRLEEIPPAPDLPLARDPASIEQPTFVRRRAHLPADAWGRVQQRASRAGLTPSGLVLAAYAEVLGTWSRNPLFTLNVTTFNRLPVHPQINEVVGDFTSLTLLAVDRSTPASFELRARRVQEQLWDDLDHRHYSGVQVVRDLARRQGRAPGALMPVIFTSRLFHRNAGVETEAEEVDRPRGEVVYSISQTPQVWLDKQVSEEDGDLVWTWDAVEDLFPEGLLDDMFSAFSQLLENLAADEESWQQESFELRPAAQRQLVAEVNRTERPLVETTLHALFAEQLRQRPEHPAVLTAERSLSYLELARHAQAVADRLTARGAEANTLVAIVMEKGWEQVVAALGVVRSGAAYLPIDPAWPAERRAYLLDNGRVRQVLTQARLVEELAWPEGIELLAVDELPPVAEITGSFASAPSGPGDLAYVIFTSGSTGQPKGVAIEHRSAVNTVLDINRRFGLTPEDRALALSALTFDLSVYDVFGLLAAGGALVMPEPWANRDPSRWSQLLHEHRVTVWNSVPALLEILLEYAATRENQIPECLRLVLLSGDWLALDVAERLRAQAPGAEVVSLGGATEASIWSISHPVRDLDPSWPSVPYGKPLDNQTFFVLDRYLRQAPTWVPGDLYIGGIGLAREYWRDEEKTATSFVTHPHTGERLYRTGDLGRFRPDGNIEFLGRADFQVKVQGYRIELGEIEAALLRHPAVASAVVTAPESRTTSGGRGPRRLVAYVVPAEGSILDREEIRSFLGDSLPSYMVPGLFVELGSLPLTANGKVDRKALPAPDQAQDEDERSGARTPIEQRLVALWTELLEAETVGIEENFFDLGGDSILAIQLINRLREELGIEISLRTLFDHLTIESLAEAVAQIRASGGEAANVAAVLPDLVPDPQARYEPFPLNDVQEAYWVGRLSAFTLGGVAAHSYTEMESAEFDHAAFTTAFRRMIDRHDALRLVFLADGRQQILEHVPPYEVRWLDLGEATEAEAERQIEAIRQQMSHQVLPADRWPLFEVRATRLPSGRTRLHLSFDLLISDAWSSLILFGELARSFPGSEETLEELEVSFRDYVLAEETIRETDLYHRCEQYWRRRLTTLPPAPQLPLARAPEAQETPRFVRRAGHLSEGEWQVLRTRGKELGLTPSGLLLAAFAEVLATWSRSPHFTLNLTTFNRLPLHPQINGVMGDFTSLTLLEVDNSSDPRGETSFALRARRLQEQLWTDLDHRYYSGVRVLRDLARAQGQATAELMPIVFTSRLFRDGRPEESSAGSSAAGGETEARDAQEPRAGEVVYSVSQTPQVWLDHQVTDQGEGISWTWDVVEDLFPEGLVDALFGAYNHLLASLAHNEELWNASSFDLLPAEQRELRAASNRTSGDLTTLEPLRLHTLVSHQAIERPDSLALVAARATGERRMSYGELERHAAGIGAWLRERGAGPNQLIAIVMEKGWEQAVAALGVQHSGAAYLPIAADLPAARLQYLLEVGEVRLVLTQSWLEDTVPWPEEPSRERLAVDRAVDHGLLPAAEPSVEPPQKACDLAYVIFTSGSTGRPKGVAIEHRGAVNTILDINRRFRVGPEDRVLALSSLSFDLSVYDLFGVLAAGGTMVIPRVGSDRDPGHWRELLFRHEITLWNSVPALLDLLLESRSTDGDGDGGVDVGTLPPSLRLALLSGDWVPLGLPDRIRAEAPDAEVISLGGATEASIWSILYPIGEVDPTWASIPYGRPMDNQTWYVLDEALRPRPTWVPGELYIGGIGLAREYWRDEEKTASSFLTLPDPEDPERTLRLYRTGDLGRYLPDGQLEFLGRADFQVKIQGHRVELGEIEAVLAEHPEVPAAVVTAPELSDAEDPSARRRRLVAYIARGFQETLESENGSAGPSPDALPAAPDRLAGLEIEPIYTPLERLEFKLRKLGLRHDLDDRALVDLPAASESLDLFASRLSYRHYLQDEISLSSLGLLLANLRQIQPQGFPLPKYRYPSGGGLYPVQLYLSVKPGRVEGLDGGIYYYQPKAHRLDRLSPEPAGDELHPPDNFPIAESSAFTLFFVGRHTAVGPLYPDLGRDFCFLEAGYMAQMLMEEAPSLGLGLCPLGGIAFEPVREHFGLLPTDELVHVVVGGGIRHESRSLQEAFLGEQVDARDFDQMQQAKAVVTSGGPAAPPGAGADLQWSMTQDIERPDWSQRAIYDPLGRLEFKLAQHGLRSDTPAEPIALAQPPWDESEEHKFTARRSYRHYEPEEIPLAALGAWLGCLRFVQPTGLPLPKYRYPSGGGLYPVQTYLHVKEGRVEGLAGGTYFYDPQHHQLRQLRTGIEIDRSLHGPPNQPIFDEAAFSLFLIGKLRAVAPLYPALARDFCLLEAGYMGQLLMQEAFDRRLGLTPLGGVGFEPIREAFDLDDDHELVHTFVGGRVAGVADLKTVLAEQQGSSKSLSGYGDPPTSGPGPFSPPAFPPPGTPGARELDP